MNDQSEMAEDDAAERSAGEDGVASEASDASPIRDIEAALSRQLDELEELVREYPLATVGIAAGIGLMAGLIIGRR